MSGFPNAAIARFENKVPRSSVFADVHITIGCWEKSNGVWQSFTDFAIFTLPSESLIQPN
jgi:hypothetical protein